MKNKLTNGIFLAALIGATLTSCTSDRNDVIKNEDSMRNQTPLNEALQQPNKTTAQCSYVDGYWSPTANLYDNVGTPVDTNFMRNSLQKIASVFRSSVPAFNFVYDPANPQSTYNAISYSQPRKINYGWAIYWDAKSKGGNIVNAMILAHEYGHQLQYSYNLPSVRENTARPNELEADGFAGYYLRRPNGYNQSTFPAIASAYEFAASIGDYQTTSSGHHGTPAQRRSAVRLGFLLGNYDLSPRDFDYNFFYYYNGVLNGTYKLASNSNFPELDKYMSQFMDELKQIQSGEISAEEFKNIH